MSTQLTAERIRTLLDYDHETGDLIWRVDRTGGTKAGDIAGSIKNHGYRMVKIDGTLYAAHRIVWAWHHGDWPINEIDHADRNPVNNRIENLRDVDRSVNVANRATWGRTGFKGVIQHRNRYVAQITIDGEHRHIGSYLTPDEAFEAFKRAHVERYGVDSQFFDDVHIPHPALVKFAAQVIEHRKAQLRARPPMDGLEQLRSLSRIRFTQREHMNVDAELLAS